MIEVLKQRLADVGLYKFKPFAGASYEYWRARADTLKECIDLLEGKQGPVLIRPLQRVAK